MTAIADRASVGVGLPQVFSRERIDGALIARCAMRAEHLGFLCLWVQEGLFTEAAMLDPIGLLSFVAPLTTSAR
ncbi:MAG: hypothetical protein ACRDL5_05295, partial [Solirubrobacteraceae bacterium]